MAYEVRGMRQEAACGRVRVYGIRGYGSEKHTYAEGRLYRYGGGRYVVEVFTVVGEGSAEYVEYACVYDARGGAGHYVFLCCTNGGGVLEFEYRNIPLETLLGMLEEDPPEWEFRKALSDICVGQVLSALDG